jgi:trigger factor
MQVTETLADGLKRGFTVVLPAADIESKRSARLADLSKTIFLPGFRPGKVPLPVVRQRYGKAVAAEVLEQSVSEATQQVMDERGLRPALQPKIDLVTQDIETAGPAKDLEFTVEVEVMPDIPLPDFSALRLTRLKTEASPEQVEERLADMARRNRELVDVTAEELNDRGAEKGEVLTIDYAGKIDGQPFPGGEGTGADVEVAGPGFIAGFAEQLEGMKPGETRTIAVTFPEDYASKELAGKPASFEVTAHRLRRAVVPAIDDEFAQKLAFDNAEELREMVKRRIQQELDALSRLRLKRELLDALTGHANFAAPEGIVEQEFQQIWQRLEAERREGRLDEEDQGKDEEALRADYRAIAQRRVRLGLMLGEIGRINGITVTPDEMTRAMRAEASRYPGRESEMMEFFRKYPAVANNLRGPIFEDKVVDYVLELAQVGEQAVPLEELTKEPPVDLPSSHKAAASEAASAEGGQGVAASGEPAATEQPQEGQG